MKAVRLHAYHEQPRLEQVPEPTITGPHDVLVRVAGAGLCRTDLHIRDGWFAPAVPTELPLTLGHENAGWVYEVGSAVQDVAVGDAVICHPQLSCGLCPACRIGDDMRCAKGLDFTGLTRAGGFAERLRTTDRGVVVLPAGLEPAAVAPQADAGLTVMHVVRKAVPLLGPADARGGRRVGGLGHIGGAVPSRADRGGGDRRRPRPGGAARSALTVARTIWRSPTPGPMTGSAELTGGAGAEAVIDFVGEGDAVSSSLAMVRARGHVLLVGYGGELRVRRQRRAAGDQHRGQRRRHLMTISASCRADRGRRRERAHPDLPAGRLRRRHR